MGKQWKQWETLFSWAAKSLQMVTAAIKLKDTCSLEEKLWPREHIKKQRHYFADKGPSSQSYGFPVVMYGCDSWTIKKAECCRTYIFDLWCWRKLSKIPCNARRSDQSFLKEISSEYSLEILMLKLKLQYFGHLNWRNDSLEKTLMLGKIEDRTKRGQQRMSCLDDITNSLDMNLSKILEMVNYREAWPCSVHVITKSQRRLRNWTSLTKFW